MNAIYFGAKRVFYAMMRVARRGFASMGLTAARFDLLFALHQVGGATQQRAIRNGLGVSRTVVSRMVRSLEKLGYVTRERYPLDRRQITVWLTWQGRMLMRKAIRLVLKSGVVQFAVDCALAPRPNGWIDAKGNAVRMQRMNERLHELRVGFGDMALLNYDRIVFP